MAVGHITSTTYLGTAVGVALYLFLSWVKIRLAGNHLRMLFAGASWRGHSVWRQGFGHLGLGSWELLFVSCILHPTIN